MRMSARIISRLGLQTRSLCQIVNNASSNFERNCVARRALLYVPGNDRRKVDKALQLNVDCIAFDFEDGVAENKKDEARNSVHELLNTYNVTKSNPEWCVRINSIATGKLCESDIDAILSAKNLPAAITLPKVDSVDHLRRFAELVWKKLMERPENDRGPINLISIIESARAIMTLPEICQKADDLATMAPIVPAGLIFGSDDFLASIGATRTNHGIELLYARQKLVLVAKAFGLQAIDMVMINFNDLKELERECNEGVAMGYTGKQVIHPSQLPIVQESFYPSRKKIKWAKAIVDEFEKNKNMGKGAFTFEGNMIDMPTVKQAMNVLNLAKSNESKFKGGDGEKK